MTNEGSIRVVAVSTVVSRFTGLLRDMFMYAVFGTSALNSAFIIAFTIPNLFRRFMGEGALTSAVVPVLATAQAQEGSQSAFALLNRVLSRSTVVLFATVIIGMILYQGVYLFDLDQRWYTSAKLGLIVFPYLIFVCLAAIVSVALNLEKHFSSAALAQIWVNLTMLTVGVAGFILSDNPFVQICCVCVGVLIGGILQLLLPGHALTLSGWKPKFDLSADPRIKEVTALLGPGLIGATISQTNMVISQFLAFGLNDQAVSVLFLANRLMQLPLGVFAVAVTTVVFPLIARRAAEGDKEGFTSAYNDGSRLIHAVMWPAGVGLALLAEPLLTAVFKWGAFDATSVAQTAPILITYALGIPLYGMLMFVTRSLHSLRDMKTPVKWGIVCLLTNLIGCVVLKEIYGTLGLAIANVGSTGIMALGLRWELSHKQHEHLRWDWGLIRLGLAVAVMAGLVGVIVTELPSSKLGSILKIVFGGGFGLLAYLSILYFIHRGALKSLWRVVAR